MSNPTFPAMPSGYKLDSKQFTKTTEDPAMRTDLEGGYVATRAKHTRRPRDTWAVAFTMLTVADYNALDGFYKDVARGGSVIIDWVNPSDDQTYSVRFKDAMTWTYAGIGDSRRWNCTFSLEQA